MPYGTTYIITTIIILSVSQLITLSLSQKLEIRKLNDPLLLLKLTDCRVQTGTIKIIHPINLNRVKQTITDLDFLSTDFLASKAPLSDILHFKLRNLHDNFKLLTPGEKRSKRWDKLGTAWKWLAGTPDADDLRIISSTLEQLIDNNNMQLLINHQIDNKLHMLTTKMNEVVALVNTYTNTSRELEVLKLITSIDAVNKVLEGIQDAVVAAKISLPHSRIFSIDEIARAEQLLTTQGIAVDTYEDVLTLATPKVTTNSETLLYILHLPQLSDLATSLLVLPITLQGHKLATTPLNLIKLNTELYRTKTPHSTVQLASDIEKFEDDCISPLIFGRNSTCTFIPARNPDVSYILDGKVLVNAAINANLSSTCGPENRTLPGTFLLSLNNCTVNIDDKQFSVSELKTEPQDLFLATYDGTLKKQIVELHNVETLKEEALATRHQLSSLFYRQNVVTWAVFTKTSVLTMLILALVVIPCLRRRHPTIQVTNQPSQPWQLWMRTLRNKKNEDVPSTTPGGVM